MPDFGVFLAPQNGGPATFEAVDAETPFKAVAIAERIHIGQQAYAITKRSVIIGRCRKCSNLVFEGERHSRYGSSVACEDCR